MSSLFDILSVMILLSSFVLMANKRIKSYIKTFRIQSLLIAIVAGILGIQLIINEGRVDVLIVCIIIVLLKVIYIPNLLRRTYLGVEHRVEKDFIWNIPILVLICCGLVVFIYFSITAIEGISEDISTIQLVNSVSVVLIGLFFMISRKKAIGLTTFTFCSLSQSESIESSIYGTLWLTAVLTSSLISSVFFIVTLPPLNIFSVF
jgi:hydrogenase-4 component E